MEYLILLRANVKRHIGTLIGLFTLMLIISLSFTTVLSVWKNSGSYVKSEMQRMGFGDLTAWVSGTENVQKLADELRGLSEVEQIGVQQLIYSDYRINEQESDSEGQMIVYDSEAYPYRVFSSQLAGYRNEPVEIAPGEIYLSSSLISMFGVNTDEEVRFEIARQGDEKTFIVKGFFEDPFMGSSMIGMKSFLICKEDYEEMMQMISQAGINALARRGAMLHIFQNTESAYSASDFNSLLNKETGLSSYIEFIHSNESILGFMLILQNAFTGFLIAFVMILLIASLVILGHSIEMTMEQDKVNMGIFKTIGITSSQLRLLQILQYLLPLLSGVSGGLIAAPFVSETVCRMTLTTTGVLIPSKLPIGLCLVGFIVLICLLGSFVYSKTIHISRISPVHTMREAVDENIPQVRYNSPIYQSKLSFWMAVRQLVSGRRRYTSVCIVAVLLVFFASLMGRMNEWLGSNGEGMMAAFNPADHDLGVQNMGELNLEEIETVIRRYSKVTERYLLAMPNLTLNGADYTANVISEPERFHILEGSTCLEDNEIVLTQFMAEDMNIGIGDSVSVSYEANSSEYIVSGIYQCANDMGKNFGMSREGYLKIGRNDSNLWCVHYFLERPDRKADILHALEKEFGGAIHVHENSWPGLYGIVSAMHMLIIFMYSIVAIFILVVVIMTGRKILFAEQKNLGIYRALGFSIKHLRLTFAMRFGLVSLLGAISGSILSLIVTDPLVAAVMRAYGISDFSSQPGWIAILLPAVVVTGLFVLFAYLISRKIKKVELTMLIAE